jgi:hypothetical protein
MSLFKPLRGSRTTLDAQPLRDGYAYFCTDDGSFHIDYTDANGNLQRKQIAAYEAEKLIGYDITTVLNSSDTEIPTSKTVSDALAEKATVEHKHTISDVTDLSGAFDAMEANYNESIIGLSVDGQTVTYIKGDGSTHTFVTQDTNTTYSLGTDETTGLTKLYATTGSAEDGTMTQKAIKTELDKKVGVSVNSTQLIFTI